VQHWFPCASAFTIVLRGRALPRWSRGARKKNTLDRINRIDRIFLLFPEETTKYSSPSAKKHFAKVTMEEILSFQNNEKSAFICHEK
jgi:hypothetical protein